MVADIARRVGKGAHAPHIVDYAESRLVLCSFGRAGPSGENNFGLSWQLVPTLLCELFNDHTSEKSLRAMNAMLQMKREYQG